LIMYWAVYEWSFFIVQLSHSIEEGLLAIDKAIRPYVTSAYIVRIKE